MNRYVYLSLITVFVFFGAGCVTIGREFANQNVSDIQNGKTTIEDIQNIFGPPYRKGIEDGALTWTYLQYRIKLFGSKDTRDLYLKFDAKGVVKSFTYNSSFPDENLLPGISPEQK